MPRIHDLDTFIQRSASILEARPDTTRLSLTYKHQVRKVDPTREATPEAEEDEDSAAAQPILYAKTFDPVSGVCFRIKITRAKQLNRLLSALGPRGVEITKVSKKKRTNKKAKLDNQTEDVNMEDSSAPAPLAPGSTAVVREKGFALTMSNTEYVEKEETPAPEAPKEVAQEKKEKKDGKKKGKKRK
ncbi:signal recognition particle 9 kDa protein-domain-containing protein [Yarrowia lipolytica]|jgi:hypothetical protein|uniref:YALI0A18942p n=2 Tax=Yarrowia lipolytica TaxID=4952 RepID=Q6CGI9_YARLI|nr:YALI0A18942p [Yarrowia lipolytica CLIB122]AOW00862.1 hypothetical protein YALI1_A19885g [Yarrowia lipolytica]KAB8283342.1 signal recognition particle 9 kDa protein-domain-containing protein [Yarrowia lipolytica]KAE8174115.1 signal recognition particle 9 kDa protein-domain-containing protein [Yarrowia lipolytica]KAJ8051813.1 signal recognition particle 9 kDa protein-domain-containing protein [Yarrowia lipolytica]QNP95401.1 Hypothetical protein YALI2_A00400g [Yarrowia lipolytica]|eukprot:XP_500223.1 YALI0A18942p [Yarrowia lipolytica CLIB122]